MDRRYLTPMLYARLKNFKTRPRPWSSNTETKIKSVGYEDRDQDCIFMGLPSAIFYQVCLQFIKTIFVSAASLVDGDTQLTHSTHPEMIKTRIGKSQVVIQVWLNQV